MSRRWKTKYEQCSQAVRDKLDKLDEMYINEYQLQVIKRKRIYPDIGDIFKICPRENIECYGIVVNNHVNNKNGDDFIVIFVFKSDVDIEQSVKKGIRKEDLLIDPEIIMDFIVQVNVSFLMNMVMIYRRNLLYWEHTVLQRFQVLPIVLIKN